MDSPKNSWQSSLIIFCSGKSKTSLNWLSWLPRSVTSKHACQTSGLRSSGTAWPLQIAYMSDADGASVSSNAASNSSTLFNYQ